MCLTFTNNLLLDRYISAVSQEMVEVSEVPNGDEIRRPHEQDDKDEAEEKEEKDDEEGEPTVIEGAE